MEHWKNAFQRILVVAGIWIQFASGYAQSGFMEALGARSLGLAQVTTTLDDISGVFGNAAAFSWTGGNGVLGYAGQPFETAELREAGIAAAFSPGNMGTFYGTIQQKGFRDFRELKIGLGYGRKLLTNFAMSAGFNFHQVRIREYGQATVPSVDLGLYGQLSKTIGIGITIDNPLPFRSNSELRIPTLMRGGVVYRPGTTVAVYGEIEKHIEHPLNIRAGMEYMPARSLTFRTGIQTEPSRVHLGVGYVIRQKWAIDLGISYHLQLGLTPGISLSFQPQKE